MLPLFIAALVFAVTLHAGTQLTAQEIVRRSVTVNQHDWDAGPSFEHQEREIDRKNGQVTDRTYAVVGMDGTPYRRLIAIDGTPLSQARERQEEDKERRELARRRSETPGERRERIDKYQKDREHDQFLMTQMAVAFTFHLIGEGDVNGHPCYVLSAEPRPDYRPVNREAKVLLGMRGKMWIDRAQFHWAKVEAEVIRTVSFAGFLARVDPGTRFVLVKEPVSAETWQPQRFEMKVVASVLFWSRNSSTTDTYRDYKKLEISRLQRGAAWGTDPRPAIVHKKWAAGARRLSGALRPPGPASDSRNRAGRAA